MGEGKREGMGRFVRAQFTQFDRATGHEVFHFWLIVHLAAKHAEPQGTKSSAFCCQCTEHFCHESNRDVLESRC